MLEETAVADCFSHHRVFRNQRIICEGVIYICDVTCEETWREGTALINGCSAYVYQRLPLEGPAPDFDWVHGYWL